ncbi:MAG: hypothetical protein ABR958_00430 [Dehalococcoidales bacterium]
MADIPERKKIILDLFQTSQCSWCIKFYNLPNDVSLCPYRGELHSNCSFFDKMSEFEVRMWRDSLFDAFIPAIMDRMLNIQSKGNIARCRKCGAFNPNPSQKKPYCWKCGESLCCPQHKDLVLRYIIEEDSWKCLLASHGQRFYRIIEPTLDEQLNLLFSLLKHNKTLYFRDNNLWIEKYNKTKEWLDKYRGGASRFDECSNPSCEARYCNIKSMLVNSEASAGRCIYPGCTQSIDK